MTQEDIIRMAREAGAYEAPLYPHIDLVLDECDFKRFADLIAAAEREACADICDQHASIEGIAQRCAEQIRGRSVA